MAEANSPATIDENPLKRFDAPVLRAMENKDLAEAGIPRTMFLPTNMGEAMEVAKLMASGNFVPPHLRGKAGDCLAVVMQASAWGMSPFAVAGKTYFVSDRMAYESQLVNAVINSSGALDGRLDIQWQGADNSLVCVVTGRIKGDSNLKVRRVAIKNITTRNSPLWKQDPEQQLAYYATRAWTRLYAPEVLMGVFTPDELADAVSPSGAAGEVRELKSVATMIEEQAREDAEDATLTPDNPTAAEGRSGEEHGDQHDGTDDEAHPAEAVADALIAEIATLNMIDLNSRMSAEKANIAAMPEDIMQRVRDAETARREELKGAIP